MLRTIFVKCKVDVMYFIFIFISPPVPRSAQCSENVRKPINKKIKGLHGK